MLTELYDEKFVITWEKVRSIYWKQDGKYWSLTDRYSEKYGDWYPTGRKRISKNGYEVMRNALKSGELNGRFIKEEEQK